MDKEYTLKIIGEANLPEPLENEKDYLISVHGSVVSKTEKPKWTGKMEEIFKFKVLTAEVLMDRGRTIKTIPTNDVRPLCLLTRSPHNLFN